MIDLFGLGKQKTDEEPPVAVDSPPEAVELPKGSPKLWMILLVMDMIIVAAFGGAVGAKIYRYWQSPSPLQTVSRQAPVKSTPPQEQPPAQAPTPAPAPPRVEPEISKQIEPSKPVAAATPAPVVQEQRTTPQEKPRKAQPVEFKLHAPKATNVQLVGAFISRGGRRDMVKSGGDWSLTLYLHPGQYRYFFSADKKKVLDPDNPRSERGASLLTVP